MVNHLNSLDGGSSVFLSRAESLSRYRQMMVYTKLKPSSSFRITERPWLANSNHFSSLTYRVPSRSGVHRCTFRHAGEKFPVDIT